MNSKKDRDSSKNEQHGDGGRAWAKAQKQIAELEEKLKQADCGAERKDIRTKIKKIRQAAERIGKGENHSQGKVELERIFINGN